MGHEPPGRRVKIILDIPSSTVYSCNMTYLNDELWNAVKMLDDAVTYLQDDAGTRDIFWTQELQDACNLLNDRRNKVCKKVLKLQGRL